jgi:hypothetical protein
MYLLTYDHLNEAVLMTGAELSNFPYAFRLYDDDGNLYFSGWSNDRDSEAAFEPLDDIQEDYGCTYIQYLQDDGEWETL